MEKGSGLRTKKELDTRRKRMECRKKRSEKERVSYMDKSVGIGYNVC